MSDLTDVIYAATIPPSILTKVVMLELEANDFGL
jgi:hypothetical protein